MNPTRRALALATFVCLLAAPRSGHACSLCIAHALGAAMHGIGAQTLPHGQLIAGISFLTFTKTAGTEDPAVTEAENYHQVSLDATYGVSDRLLIRGSIPYVNKAIQQTGGPKDMSGGLGDIQIG